MIRVGICGLGSASRRAHIPALREAPGRVAIVAVCDPDPRRGELVPEARFHDDAVSLLDGSRPDLVVIASPPSAHLEAIAAAAERGVDVLCEKPLGVGPGDVEALHDITRRHPDLLVATVLQYRHAPAWAQVVSLVESAQSGGEPFSLEVTVERPGTDPLSAGGWRARGDREGGILGDHAVHYLSLCRDLEAAARVVACRRSGDPGRETAHVRLSLGAGHASVHVSYAGTVRRNDITARLRDDSVCVRWTDAELVTAGLERPTTVEPVGALSNRQFVNELYRNMYVELFDRAEDRQWRATATAETLAVAALLADCLGRAH